MHEQKHPLVPSTFELWYVGLASLMLFLIGNGKLILERYGLVGSSDEVRKEVLHQVGNGLNTLDSFKFTPTLVTFITWGVIGLALGSIVYTIAHTVKTAREGHSLTSNAYIHPRGFDSTDHHRHIALHTVLLLALPTLLIIALALYLLFVLPVGFTYARHFILHVSPQHILDLLAGIFTVFTGTLALYVLAKLTVRHQVYHHRSSEE